MQPKALSFLFLTEMWERFGFYVVQGLLVLYMSQYFGFSDDASYTILGIFTALVYISPLAGGYLASKLLGYQTAIIWGGLLLVLGYALLALPNAALFFYPALSVIIIGNGLLKPNISSLLGLQYKKNDARRDAGFTIFYIGINVGAILAGFSSGYIKNYFGWHLCFALASLGLLIGLATFYYGLNYLKRAQHQLRPSRKLKYQLFILLGLSILAAIVLFHIHTLADWLLPCVGILLVLGLVMLTFKQTASYRSSMLILIILILASVAFWALLFQIFYSANLFVDRLVNKNIFGFHLSTTVFYASEGVFIILLGPLFAKMWRKLSEQQKNPRPLSKFILGIFFAGLGFLLLSISTHFPNLDGLIMPYWVFISYLLITIGELLLSPIGLSAITALSPPHLTGFMMGVWFVATGFGGIFAGWIAKFASIPTNTISTAHKLLIYQHAFLNDAYLAFTVVIILLFTRQLAKRLFDHP